ncbi:MAG: hypothetical protein ABSE83_12070 [Methanobacterium sp.]
MDDLKLGKSQNFEKNSVIPVMGVVKESSVYLTLKKALDMNLLQLVKWMILVL